MATGLAEAPGIGKLLVETRFSVPNHQRDYSWTVDEVKELVDDLTQALKNKNDAYFVGLMVFLGTVDQQELSVLDGQQRLATSVIIFAAIRGWLRQFEEYKQDADDIQRDYIGRRQLGQKDLQPRITMNVANDKSFNDFVVKSSSIAEIQSALDKMKRRDRNRRLLEAAAYIHERIKEIAEEFPDSASAAKYFFDLVNFMRDKFGVVRLIVPSDEMAYTMFETLNDRGLELSPLDLVKNHMFARAAEHSPERIKVLESRWAQMMQTLSSARSDHFLKAFWTSRHGRIRTRSLFTAFKKQYGDAETTNDLSSEMLEAAEQYAALETADDPVWAHHTDKTRAIVRSLKTVGSQQIHPVMLAALAKFSVPEVERLLRLLEVCIVRYLLVGGGNTGRFETTCAILARKIYAQEIKTATGAFAELKDVYPPDDEFKRTFELKEEDNNQKAQYFLRKLEIEKQRVAGGKMPGELEPGGALTVEHILPKSPGKEWEAVLKGDPEIHTDCLFLLGNLCLMTGVNKDIGRKGFEEKKKFFAVSKLITTKEVAAYQAWNRQNIQNRQQALANLAASAWRFN
jgi:hypothetical protein